MRAEWLRELLRKNKMSQAELARRIGVSRALVSSWISGTRNITPANLKAIAKVFGLSEGEVFRLAGVLEEAFEVSPEVVFVPVLSPEIPCGTPREAFDEYIVGVHPILREMLEMSVGRAYYHGLKIYFLRAEGDSMMEAGITPGSFVLFSPDLEVQSGDIAVVEVDAEGLTIKQVFFRGDTVVLEPKNSRYEPRILGAGEVQIKGKVLLVLNYFNHLRRV
ncbi:MAG: helix-turn-helix domain-containing protein [Candidatus Caldatribacterium sp.]|nr:helix-turn-helix domain-containing protein [Candidatus Caldatribacterium sp.]